MNGRHPDGMRHNLDTGNAFACSPSSRKNLGGLTPSVAVSGTVALDAPTEIPGASVLVLKSIAMDTGWEWPIPGPQNGRSVARHPGLVNTSPAEVVISSRRGCPWARREEITAVRSSP